MSESNQPPEFTVNELADEAGVTRRTVHYYIAQGLLPASGTEGRGSRYGKAHLDRLLLIRQLQREHLPLAEIRSRLERLTDAQVSDLLAVGSHLAEPRGSAYDYIQSVLAGSDGRVHALQVSTPRAALKRSAGPAPAAPLAPAPAPRPAAAGEPASARGAARPAVSAPSGAPFPDQAAGPPPAGTLRSAVRETPSAYETGPTNPGGRSQWDRITLAPDIELHIRRPLSRFHNRAVDKLVAFARQLLEEDPS